MKWWILVILKYFPCSSSPFPRPPTPRSWRSTLCKRATVWRRRCSSLLLSPMLFLGDKKVLNTPRMKSSWMSLRSWTSWYEQFLLLSFHRLLVMVPSLIVRLLVPFIWSAVCQACLNSSSVLFSLSFLYLLKVWMIRSASIWAKALRRERSVVAMVTISILKMFVSIRYINTSDSLTFSSASSWRPSRMIEPFPSLLLMVSLSWWPIVFIQKSSLSSMSKWVLPKSPGKPLFSFLRP